MVDASKPDHPVAPLHRVPPTRRQIIAQVVVSAVILVSGIAIGSGGTILALKDRIVPAFSSPTRDGNTPGRDPNEAGKRANWIVTRWKDDYGLSDEQVRQAQEILGKEFAATERLWQEFHKAEETQRQKFVLAMKGILTPEQFTKWDAEFRRMVEHMQKMRPFDPRRGGRGGPPGDRRPDGRPDHRMDPNNRRGDGPPGPPRDPNGPRGDRSRDRFRGPEERRDDGARDRFGDSSGQREPRPPEPNDRPGVPPEPK